MENTRRLGISWNEMVQIGKQLYKDYGDNLDIHELILYELKQSPSIKDEPSPKLKRGNTHEKINDGIKFARNMLLHGIRKVSSSPAP